MIENIRLSFEGIWSHKMRSFLTMLGVIIGIASIIAIVSTIKGTSEELKNQIVGGGKNIVTVELNKGDSPYEVDGSETEEMPILTKQQKEDVRNLTNVESASFYYSRTYADSVYHNNVSFNSGKIFGVDQDYLRTAGYTLQSGRNFIQSDYDLFRKVVILDENAAITLFESENGLGKTIEIKGEPFTVIGIVREDERTTLKIQSLDDYYTYFQDVSGCILVPDASWPIIYQYDEPQNVILKVTDTEEMSKAGKAAADIMNQNLNVKNSLSNIQQMDSDSADPSSKSKFLYKADNLLEKAKSLQEVSEKTNQQLIWIAGISLLVGGIGVMNIMLVSVTERTKEIGLKKAIGARKRTILAQFLTEAAVLTSLGGMMGVALGLIFAQVVHRVSGTPTAISVPAIIGSVLFSMLIGIIFGFLPSVQAANLNPIDALRSE